MNTMPKECAWRENTQTRRSIPFLLIALCAAGPLDVTWIVQAAPRSQSSLASNAPSSSDAPAPSPPSSHDSSAQSGAATVPASAALAIPDLPSYIKEVEQIRGLTFKKMVTSRTQTLAEFRGFIQKDLDAELPPFEAACTSHAFSRLGLLPEGFDLRKAFSDLLVTQVAAYYDPYGKTFSIVRPDIPEDFLRPTIIHELTHALQDQRFDLETRVKVLQKMNNDDMENAFRFLAEGEATYVMMLAALRDQGVSLETDKETVDRTIDMGASLNRKTLASQLEGLGTALGPESAEVEAVLSYPEYFFRTLFDPYFTGQRALHRVYRAGGWEAVNELWRNPPTSTEMFLHPEKLAKGKRDEPVKVELPDLSSILGSGYKPGCENTLGELETEILLEETLPETTPRAGAGPQSSGNDPDDPGDRVARARLAASGWGGDRVRAFEKDGSGTVVVWKTVWDTNKDAIEFDQAIRATFPARMPQGEMLPLGAPEAPATPGKPGTASVAPGAASGAPGTAPGAPGTASGAPGAASKATPAPEPVMLWGRAEPKTESKIEPSSPVLLVARCGVEVTFVSSANAGQARAILASLYPSLAPAPQAAPKPAPASGGTRR